MEIKQTGFRDNNGAELVQNVQEPQHKRDQGNFTRRGGWRVLVIILMAATGVGIVRDCFTLPYPHPFPVTVESPPTWLWLGLVACFSPWKVSKRDASRLPKPVSVGLEALALRHHRESAPV